MIRILGLCVSGYLGIIVLAPLWHAATRALSAWLPWLRNLPMPNLAVLVTLYLALAVRDKPSAGAAGAAAIGYLTDLLSGAPKGTHILSLLLVYFAIRGMSSRLYVRGRLSQIGVAFLAALFHAMTVVAIHVALPPRGQWSTLAYAPVEAGMTGAVAPLIFYLFWRLDRRLAREAATEGVFR